MAEGPASRAQVTAVPARPFAANCFSTSCWACITISGSRELPVGGAASTPMNAIVGMADLLWDTELTPDQRKYLRIFRRAGSSLLHLINDILDLSKVEAGHIELESIEFDLSDLVEKAIEILAMRANEKGLELACHLSPDVPCSLVGDPNRLHQILVNLISNAIKFTDKGSVVVEVVNDPEHPMPGAIRFSVTDTGIGVPPGKLAKIFERFTQAHASITRKYGGTGLGLTISKQLAELMHGKIWVESTLGNGSTFHCLVRLGVNSSVKTGPATLPIDLQRLEHLLWTIIPSIARSLWKPCPPGMQMSLLSVMDRMR